MRPIRAGDIKARARRSLASFLIKPLEFKDKRLHARLQRGSHGSRGKRRGGLCKPDGREAGEK